MAAPTEISLRDFVRTGQFGVVGLGLSRPEVHARLGFPDRVTPDCDHYGSFEFSYCNQELCGICNASLHPAFGHFDNHLFANQNIEVNPWLLSDSVLRLGAIIEFLESDGMAYTVLRDGPRPILQFPSGVQLRFDIHEHHGRIRGNSHAELYYIGIERPKNME